MPSQSAHAPVPHWPTKVLWGGLVLLLLTPLLAMQVTDEVKWDVADFAVFATMLAALGLGVEAALRADMRRAFKAMAVFAVVAVFLLVWAQLAVGIIPA